MSPIAARIDIAELQLARLSEFDSRHSIRDLAGDELNAAQRRFMVEQDAARGVQPETLTVVHGHPMSVKLGGRIGRARIERRGLALPRLLDHPEHLRGGGLVESCAGTNYAYRFEPVHAAERGHIGGEQRLLPG